MIRYIVSLIIVTFLFSCKDTKAPDVSHIAAEIEIVRTENQLSSIKSIAEIDKLMDTHKAFYSLYFPEVLSIRNANNPDSLYEGVSGFLKDTLISKLFSQVDAKYSDLSSVKSEATQMYQYLQYYFPLQISVPRIYTFISEYGYQAFIFQDDNGNDGIGLGLDMFLSPDIDYKSINPDNTNFSSYITRTWNRDHIVPKIADLHITEIIGDAPGHKMLDQMIHNGKALYIKELILPKIQDSLIFEYTGEQLQWCQDNELEMWSFFLDKKLFYESNPVKIGKYINPSPNSPDMPADSPGRTANFIGYKIVKAYMDRYPKTTLAELIAMKDCQQLMEKSKYKPTRK
jgi:hypothetical protein